MEDALDVVGPESRPASVDTTSPGLTSCRPRIAAASSSAIESSTIVAGLVPLRAQVANQAGDLDWSYGRAICMLMFSELTQTSIGCFSSLALEVGVSEVAGDDADALARRVRESVLLDIALGDRLWVAPALRPGSTA